MLKSFLSTIASYKELVLLVVSLVSAVFFVRDYFATKGEVNVLKCQMRNSIDIVESRMDSDDLTKRIVRLKIEIEEGKGKLLAAKISNPATNEWLISLDTEIDKLENEVRRQEAKRRQAAENLLPGGLCERAEEES